MRRLLLPIALGLLAGCLAPAPRPDPVATISFQGETYPIERLESFPEQWRVRTSRGPVPCRAPTERDCYWSLRAFLLAQQNPDLIGN
jgi:hypothetical protein